MREHGRLPGRRFRKDHTNDRPGYDGRLQVIDETIVDWALDAFGLDSSA